MGAIVGIWKEGGMKEGGHLFPQLLPGASCSLVRQLSPYSPLCFPAPILQADSFCPQPARPGVVIESRYHYYYSHEIS